MPKKIKPEKIDGLGADDIKKIRSALRQVWSWSHARRLVVKRCLQPDGYSICEKCKQQCPKIHVDHIQVLGEVTGLKYIERMWTPSKNLQGLCKKCHDAKTKQERHDAKEIEKGFY